MTNSKTAPSVQSLLRHADWVLALAKSLVLDPNTADDVAQNAWIEVIRKPPQHAHNPRGFLSTVVRHAARRIMRGERRRQHRERELATPGSLQDTKELARRAGLQRDLVSHVLQLKDPYRSVLLMHFFEGHSTGEIAVRLKRPLNTIQTQLQRGLDRLRQRLDTEYGDRSAWGLAFLPLVNAKYGAHLARSSTALSFANGGWGLWLALVIAVPIAVFGLRSWAEPAALHEATTSREPMLRVAEPESQLDATVVSTAANDRTPVPTVDPSRLPAEPDPASAPPGEKSIIARLVDPQGRPLAGFELQFEPEDRPKLLGDMLWYGNTGVNLSGLPEIPSQLPEELRLALIGSAFNFMPEKYLAGVDSLLKTGSVDWGGARTTTAANGWFELPHEEEGHALLPDGFIGLGLCKSGLPGGEDEPLMIACQTLRVMGSVVDSAGRPISGANLEANFSAEVLPNFPSLISDSKRGAWATSSRSDGSFEFLEIPHLPWLPLTLSKSGFQSSRVYLSKIDPLNARFVLKKNKPSRDIAGRVFWPDGTPAEGASIKLGHDEGTSDLNGRFRIAISNQNRASNLTAHIKGHGPGVLEGIVAALERSQGHLDELVISLGQPTSGIDGLVTDFQGVPMPGVSIRLMDPTPLWPNSSWVPEEDETTTNDQGEFHLGELAARPYRLRVINEEAKRSFLSDPIHPGAKVTLAFPETDELIPLHGRVQDRNGSPVAGVELTYSLITSKRDTLGAPTFASYLEVSKTVSAQDGSFEFEGVSLDAALFLKGDNIKFNIFSLAQTDPFLSIQVITVDVFHRFRLVPPSDDSWDSFEFHGLNGRLLFLAKKPGVNSYHDRMSSSSDSLQPQLHVDLEATHLVLFLDDKEVRRIPIQGTLNEITHLDPNR